MLDLFDTLGVKGTWFVQGLVARDFPDLVRAIAARGHELGCHAHSHRPLFRMSDAELEAEIGGARARIQDVAGVAVDGFRAPDFSLGPPARELAQVERRIFAVLVRHGFRFDSSVVPVRMRRYGVSRVPSGPFCLREGLVEVPLATVRVPFRLPALGGGYLRIFPLPLHRLAVAQAAREQRVPVIYLHPYELDRTELDQVRRTRPVPWRLRLSQSWGRPTVRHKLSELTRGRSFIRMGELAARVAAQGGAVL
jgi:polysaccharide deacetylase family protein (PEP-CTERM system associated)